MDKIVGIGDYIISKDEGDTIKTFALASCVAVTAYDMRKKIAGMIHMALPTPLEHGNTKPGYYVTSGLPSLINDMHVKYDCNFEDLKIGVFGGSNSIHGDMFNIGERNLSMTKKVIRNMGLRISFYEEGGTISRTIYLEVGTGSINIISQPMRI